jgi:predicted ATP-dependent endonuclease of OLD family
MIPYIELIGPDRSGKSTILNCFRKRLEKDKFSFEFIQDRGIADSVVLDAYFNRTNEDVLDERLAFLESAKQHYEIIYVHSSAPILQNRVDEEFDKTDAEDSFMNKVKVDSSKQLELYDFYYGVFKSFMPFVFEYDTSLHSTDFIVDELLKNRKERDL